MKDDFDMQYLNRRKDKIKQQSHAIKTAIEEQHYFRMVDKFQSTFDNHIRELLQVLKDSKRYDSHIANLATRLDYNGYYSDMFSDTHPVIL